MKGTYVKGRSIEQHISEHMRKPGFKKAWKALDTEFELLESFIKAREKAGVTQAELAERLGTKQAAISRLETGSFAKATLETLNNVADALDMRLVIRLQKKRMH